MLACPNPCAWKLIEGGVLTTTVGAVGATTVGVTGLKSIALGKVGCNATGAGTVIAPLFTILGLILADISNDTGGSGTVLLLANPYELYPFLEFVEADLGSLLCGKYWYIELSLETYLLNAFASLVNIPS